MALFETSVVVPVSPEQAFDFLIRPANHEQLSPPGVGLRFTKAPEVFQLGSTFEFKIQAWGIVQTSQHEIIQFERASVFTERQTKGPLKLWEHEHRFEVNGDGHTVIIDVIQFAPPGGLAGMLVTEAKILDSLEDGFYHRHQQLKKLLTSPA